MTFDVRAGKWEIRDKWGGGNPPLARVLAKAFSMKFLLPSFWAALALRSGICTRNLIVLIASRLNVSGTCSGLLFRPEAFYGHPGAFPFAF